MGDRLSHEQIACPQGVLNMTFYGVNRTLFGVSAIMRLFVAQSLIAAPCASEDVGEMRTMCGNLVIRNQILTQFRLRYVLIRT